MARPWPTDDRRRRALLDPAGHRGQRLRGADRRQADQPADNIAPLVRNDLLAKVDKTSFEKILNDVSAR